MKRWIYLTDPSGEEGVWKRGDKIWKVIGRTTVSVNMSHKSSGPIRFVSASNQQCITAWWLAAMYHGVQINSCQIQLGVKQNNAVLRKVLHNPHTHKASSTCSSSMVFQNSLELSLLALRPPASLLVQDRQIDRTLFIPEGKFNCLVAHENNNRTSTQQYSNTVVLKQA